MAPEVIIALIGLPTQLLIAVATFVKARSTDAAVNHRVNGTTLSQDVMDLKAEMRSLRTDVVWLIKAHGDHLREHGRDHQPKQD